MGDAMLQLVSVIIPVFNDAERLEACLAALGQQTYGGDCLEVLVIDNGSADRAAVERAIAPFPWTQLAVEPTAGSYAARNRGLDLARGEVIAFTDADCIPAADWVEQGVACLTGSPGCDMVAGEIEVFPQNSQKPNLLEVYQLIVSPFPQEAYLRQFKGGATANVFTRKAVIERVGKFNPKLKSFGDLEWGQRVFAAGYRQVYAPSVRVRHPARCTWREMTQKNARVAGGVYDYFVKPDDSWLQRHKTYARLVWDDLALAQSLIPTIAREGKGYGWGQRCRVAALALWLRGLSTLEKTRLHFGGISERV